MKYVNAAAGERTDALTLRRANVFVKYQPTKGEVL